MTQPRRWSLLEVCCSTAFGFLIAYLSNALIFPRFGYQLPPGKNFLITCLYTIISILRSYIFRRLFNRISG